jgi:hypothetical protein
MLSQSVEGVRVVDSNITYHARPTHRGSYHSKHYVIGTFDFRTKSLTEKGIMPFTQYATWGRVGKTP